MSWKPCFIRELPAGQAKQVGKDGQDPAGAVDAHKAQCWGVQGQSGPGLLAGVEGPHYKSNGKEGPGSG